MEAYAMQKIMNHSRRPEKKVGGHSLRRSIAGREFHLYLKRLYEQQKRIIMYSLKITKTFFSKKKASSTKLMNKVTHPYGTPSNIKTLKSSTSFFATAQTRMSPATSATRRSTTPWWSANKSLQISRSLKP